jgi:hypothetical protein
MSRVVSGLALLGVAAVCFPVSAHFVLETPEAMFQQSAMGDPQKAPPCGDNNGNAVPTNIVTTYQSGQTITVTIDETIYHPGHYRIALAVNDPSELPPEPIVTPGNTACGSAPIMDPPVFPVLADGVFEHTAPFSGPQSIDITLPNDVTCTNCTLQIIQFMSNHALNNPGGCYYHHCATIAIQTEPVVTTSSTTTSGAGGNTSGNGGASNTGGSAQSGGADGADGAEDGGCSCALIGTDRRAGAAWLALGAFALLALGRRRPR